MKKIFSPYNTLDDLYESALSATGVHPDVVQSLEDTRRGLRTFFDRSPQLVAELLRNGIIWNRNYSLSGLFGTPKERTVVTAILATINLLPVDSKLAAVLLLGHAKKPFDGTVLIDIFEQDSSPQLKYLITTLVANGRVLGVDKWVRKVMIDPAYGEYREILLGLADLQKNKDGLLAILMHVFDDDPMLVVRPISKLGGEPELSMLFEKRAALEQTHLKNRQLEREIDKAISKIKKRLARV